MIMADVLTWFLIILGLLIVFNCYWLAAIALFPNAVNRAQEAYARPILITVLGLAIAVPLIVLGIAIAKINNPAFKLLGISTIAVPILAGLIGSAGLSRRIGDGMASPIDEHQPWRRVLRGGIVLSFLFLLPFVGWFGLLPWTLISGVGAAVRSFATRRKQQNSTPPPVALTPSTEAAQ